MFINLFFLFIYPTSHHPSIHRSIHSPLPFHPSNHLFVQTYPYLPICIYIYLSFHFHPHIHPAIHPSTYPIQPSIQPFPIYPAFNLVFYPAFHLFIQSVHLPIHPSSHLFINLYFLLYNWSSSSIPPVHPSIHPSTDHPFFHLLHTCSSIHAFLYSYACIPIHLLTNPSSHLHPFIHSPIYPFSNLLFILYFMYLFIHIPILITHLFIHLSNFLYMNLFTYPSIHSNLLMAIYPSIYLPIY